MSLSMPMRYVNPSCLLSSLNANKQAQVHYMTSSFAFSKTKTWLYMQTNNLNAKSRRDFLGKLAAGAAALGTVSLAPFQAQAENELREYDLADPEAWFNKIKGKHRIVFDATQPHELMPFAWPKVFLLTNEATGTPQKDCSVVVVLRH